MAQHLKDWEEEQAQRHAAAFLQEPLSLQDAIAPPADGVAEAAAAWAAGLDGQGGLPMMYPMPMLPCDPAAAAAYQEQAAAAAAAYGWPCGLAPGDEVRFGSVSAADYEPMQIPGPWSTGLAPDGLDAEDGREQSSGATASARRRQRRQRAAQRHPEMSEPVRPHVEGEPDCEELTKGLQAGGEARDAALESLKGWVVRLAFAKDGCRVVQEAMTVADHGVAGELLSELKGHVQEALASPHANYVLQALISGLPTATSAFVVQELQTTGAATARHRFGCRVLCRLVEHAGQASDMKALLGEVLEEAEDLCRHSFAHYVMQSMLEHLPEHRVRIATALRADLAGHARHRCASHVVEAALEYCAEEERRLFVTELLGPGVCNLVDLAQSQYGSFVLKAVLRLQGPHQDEAWRKLKESAEIIESSKYGQRLLKDLNTQPAPV